MEGLTHSLLFHDRGVAGGHSLLILVSVQWDGMAFGHYRFGELAEETDILGFDQGIQLWFIIARNNITQVMG